MERAAAYLILIALIVLIAYPKNRDFLYGLFGWETHVSEPLPDCNSVWGLGQVDNAIARAPMGQAFGLPIVQYKDIQTVSSTTTLVQCKATVVLSNDTTREASYSFEFDDSGGQLVRAQVLGVEIADDLCASTLTAARPGR